MSSPSLAGLIRKPNESYCRWCWHNWGIVCIVRRDSECVTHHSLTTCQVHGSIDCFDARDGCPGSVIIGYDPR